MDLTFQPKGKRAYDLNLSVNKVRISTVFVIHGTQSRLGKAVIAGRQPGKRDKVTIAVTVRNIGKGTLKKTESYLLKCSSTCPFNKTSYKLNKALAPNKSSIFKLTSKALKAGNYDPVVK